MDITNLITDIINHFKDIINLIIMDIINLTMDIINHVKDIINLIMDIINHVKDIINLIMDSSYFKIKDDFIIINQKLIVLTST